MSNPLTLGQCSGAGASSSRPLLRSPQRSTSTLSKPRGLQSSSKRVISLFLLRNLLIKRAFSFFCDRHRKSCPRIASLVVSSLLSSADFKSRPKTQGSSSSDLSFSSSHIGLHERWSLRSNLSVDLVIITLPSIFSLAYRSILPTFLRTPLRPRVMETWSYIQRR